MFKKYGILFLMIFLVPALVTGCTQNPGVSAQTASPSVSGVPATGPIASSPSLSPPQSGKDQQALLQEILALLNTEGNEKAAADSLHRLLPMMSPETAKAAVLEFETYQKAAVLKGVFGGALVQLIQSSTKEPYDEDTVNDITGIQSPDLKKALQDLFDRGYKIIIPEGNFQAVINYDTYKGFKPYLPPEIAAYIDIMARESENRTVEDGGLIIPVDEVFTRALACESFLKKYPSSLKAGDVKSMYDNYIDACFFGQNNTPAFDYSTNELNREFYNSYRIIKSQGPSDDPLVSAVADYLKVLGENKLSLTQTVADYRKNTTEHLKNIVRLP